MEKANTTTGENLSSLRYTIGYRSLYIHNNLLLISFPYIGQSKLRQDQN